LGKRFGTLLKSFFETGRKDGMQSIVDEVSDWGGVGRRNAVLYGSLLAGGPTCTPSWSSDGMSLNVGIQETADHPLILGAMLRSFGLKKLEGFLA